MIKFGLFGHNHFTNQIASFRISPLTPYWEFVQIEASDVCIPTSAMSWLVSAVAHYHTSIFNTKHIDIQYHFVRDSLAKKLYLIDYCATSSMAADMLTKPLERVLLERFKTKMGLDTLARYEHVTEGECWSVWAFCHMSLKASSVTLETCLIVFGVCELVNTELSFML